ncbi:acyl-CoA dehydrogenase family protein [Actinomadura sp. SCN-SB]|uniref:acyl-CoA dehydrogenase family protein n=1 Tax=Actinomadura sp. SCN-SB TaxID=3373092 RepID=UPI003750464B
MDLAVFRRKARDWLEARTDPRAEVASGPDDVSIFHDLPFEEERALIRRAMAWHQEKFDAGYGAIGWPQEYGGAGLGPEYEDAFAEEEARREVPAGHELFRVTVHLIAPTLRIAGPDGFVRRFLRAEQMCVQLFSEPGAGSDLAGLATRAVRDGDDWLVTGQKVWSSGAQFADWGLLIARTDPDVPKHTGMTAFLVPMDAEGVTVRPLRQMSGGASFNEVFLDGVRVADALRVGDVGQGWKVALTALGFERKISGGESRVGGGWRQLLPLARRLGRLDDPVVRQLLAEVYINECLAKVGAPRDVDSGPAGSLRKLHWVNEMAAAGRAAEALLGAGLAADTGERGTFSWTAHVLGAPGYRIAGGSDEIQRNIIAERLLGLPGEPRADRDRPWRELPR